MISAAERDLRWSLITVDILAFWISLPVTVWISHRNGAWLALLGGNLLLAGSKLAALSVVWYFSLHEMGVYETHHNKLERFSALSRAVLIFWLLLTAISFLSFRLFSRATMLLMIPVLLFGVIVLRTTVALLLFRIIRPTPLRVLVLGSGPAATRLLACLGTRIGLAVQHAPLSPLDSLANVKQMLSSERPDELLVACEGRSSDDLVELLNHCRLHGIRWEFVPDPGQMIFSGTTVRVMAGLPLIAFQGSEISGLNLLRKRAFDLLASCLITLFISPLLLAIWLAVRLTSPGPALYRQQRIGFKGQRFEMYKFRSMYLNNDDKVHRQYATDWIKKGKAAANSDGIFKIAGDKRITSIGSFLRKYSLDELPQIFNVLKGDMSLVGPRPAMPYEVEAYQDWHKQRFDALPGITGLWQVTGRNAVSFDRMVELDIEYLRNWTLSKDVSILARTIPVVLFATGH